MPNLSGMRIFPPKSWEDFQDITLSCLKIKWGNSNLFQNGRKGQPQNGVDIWGNNEAGHLVGVQCKLILEGIGPVSEEAVKAENFKPKICAFYVATTSSSDAKLQEKARLLSEERISNGKFPVAIFFWEDLIQELEKDKDEFSKHYPDIVRPRVADHACILEITSTLDKLGRLQFQLVEKRAERKVKIEVLSRIQKELQQQWEIPEYYPYRDVDVKTMGKLVSGVTNKLGIDMSQELSNEHLDAMRRIGWALDKYEIGLTRLQQNGKYKALDSQLSEQRVKGRTSKETNECVKKFLFFLYGIDSLYLFYRYMPLSHISKFPSQFVIVSSQFKQIRDETLKLLLIEIQQSA